MANHQVSSSNSSGLSRQVGEVGFTLETTQRHIIIRSRRQLHVVIAGLEISQVLFWYVAWTTPYHFGFCVTENTDGADLTVVVYTWPLVGNWLFHCRQDCLKVVDPKRIFFMGQDTSSYAQPPGEMQLTNRLNLSASLISSPCKNKVFQQHFTFRKCRTHSKHVYTKVQTTEKTPQLTWVHIQ